MSRIVRDSYRAGKEDIRKIANIISDPSFIDGPDGKFTIVTKEFSLTTGPKGKEAFLEALKEVANKYQYNANT